MAETGIVERLKQLARNYADGTDYHQGRQLTAEDSMYFVAASLIERQQKAIDLLLKAIEPFAETMSYFLEEGLDGDEIDKILLGSNIAPAHLRAARSAKEQAEKILNQQGEGS